MFQLLYVGVTMIRNFRTKGYITIRGTHFRSGHEAQKQ